MWVLIMELGWFGQRSRVLGPGNQGVQDGLRRKLVRLSFLGIPAELFLVPKLVLQYQGSVISKTSTGLPWRHRLWFARFASETRSEVEARGFTVGVES